MIDANIAAIRAPRWKAFWSGFKAACEAMETTHGEYQETRIGLIEKRLVELEAVVNASSKLSVDSPRSWIGRRAIKV